MMSLRRIGRVLCLGAAVSALLAGTAAALPLDVGGSITSISTFQTRPDGSDEPMLTNSERLTLYLNTPLGSSLSLETQVAGRLDANPFLVAGDVERFYLQRVRMPEQGSLSEFVTRMGRLTITDPGGLVVRHPVDGLALILRYPLVEFGMSGGYTGFVNKEFSRVSMSLYDSLDSEDDDVYFGPARLIGQARLALRNVVFGQSLSAAFIFQQDLRDPEKVVQVGEERAQILAEEREPGGLLNTQYVLALVDGAIPSGAIPGQLFHEVAYVLNLGSTLSEVEDDTVQSGASFQYRPVRGHLVRLKLSYFLQEYKNSSAGLGFTYSSGDSSYRSFTEGNRSDVSNMFIPVTASSSGTVFGVNHGNSTVLEVFYSLMPFGGDGNPFLDSFQLQAAWYSFFRSAGTGAVSSSSIDPASDTTYLGSEVDLAFRFRPFSDFGFGLSTGVFFAHGDALVDGANSVDFLARLDASLSF